MSRICLSCLLSPVSPALPHYDCIADLNDVSGPGVSQNNREAKARSNEQLPGRPESAHPVILPEERSRQD